jgi:hypothetical protein
MASDLQPSGSCAELWAWDSGPRSIDLGAIGDGPLNQEPIPHHPAEWEKPFPCDWTNTCFRPAVVVVPWGMPR